MPHTPFWLASADPGSSDKGWAIATYPSACSRKITVEKRATAELGAFVSDLVDRTRTQRVLLCIDAPLRAFGGLQCPTTFDPPGSSRDKTLWPFDANPFVQRPCERALAARPPSSETWTAIGRLTDEIRALCTTPNTAAPSSFSSQHDGLSVMGYMSAPHAPVVRTFLDHLMWRAADAHIAVDFDLPNSADNTTPGLTILESHPALALAFHCTRGSAGFPKSLPKYKKNKATILEFMKIVVDHFDTAHKLQVSRTKDDDDDQLDALVGLDLLLDLCAGKGDIFGTARDGFFLIPRLKEDLLFRDLWQAASDEFDKARALR